MRTHVSIANYFGGSSSPAVFFSSCFFSSPGFPLAIQIRSENIYSISLSHAYAANGSPGSHNPRLDSSSRTPHLWICLLFSIKAPNRNLLCLVDHSLCSHLALAVDEARAVSNLSARGAHHLLYEFASTSRTDGGILVSYGLSPLIYRWRRHGQRQSLHYHVQLRGWVKSLEILWNDSSMPPLCCT